MEIAFVVAWLTSGVAFFIATGRHSGWPDRWRSRNTREPAWFDLLAFYLPLMLAFGPLLWVGFTYIRLKK